ncbi:plasmid pRiA4b ORF-3 family protein [Ruegeria sp.]|uniref:plasmid pRiA4b ORF-3 family protein n=1 Tax=Ruegeria sp. TaxID=1879320 RepID=UPI003B002DC7
MADHKSFIPPPLSLQARRPPLTTLYEYDFGDNWRHVLRLERATREEKAKYPRCIAAARSGPPEDSGGPSGYACFLEAWRDPGHEDHKAMRGWAGRRFNPDRVDLDQVNKDIAKALRVSKGDYRFRRDICHD